MKKNEKLVWKEGDLVYLVISSLVCHIELPTDLYPIKNHHIAVLGCPKNVSWDLGYYELDETLILVCPIWKQSCFWRNKVFIPRPCVVYSVTYAAGFQPDKRRSRCSWHDSDRDVPPKTKQTDRIGYNKYILWYGQDVYDPGNDNSAFTQWGIKSQNNNLKRNIFSKRLHSDL